MNKNILICRNCGKTDFVIKEIRTELTEYFPSKIYFNKDGQLKTFESKVNRNFKNNFPKRIVCCALSDSVEIDLDHENDRKKFEKLGMVIDL